MENYYSNQIKGYNSEYDISVTKIEEILVNLGELYDSFAGASGNDIEKIRNDLNELNKELQSIKQKISDAQDKTNEKAANCDIVLKKANNTPQLKTFFSKDYAYESTGNKKVYIKNGYIYFEETIRRIPIDQYNGLFGAVAGIGKLFGAYEVNEIIIKANSEFMQKGELKWDPVRPKYNTPDYFLNGILDR